MDVERRTRRSPRMGGAAQKSRADRRQLSDSSDTGRSSDSGTDDASTHDTASEDTSDKDLVPILSQPASGDSRWNCGICCHPSYRFRRLWLMK